MPTNKVRDEILATLSSKLKQACLAYLVAQSEEKQLAEVARSAIRARREHWKKLYDLHKRVDGDSCDSDKTTIYASGTILFNLRNGRFYEASPPPKMGSYSWQTFKHLSAKTAMTTTRSGSYAYGPKIQLPDSHPFVKKRANARLAERLEGKDV